MYKVKTSGYKFCRNIKKLGNTDLINSSRNKIYK